MWDIRDGKKVIEFDWLNQAKDGASSIKFDEQQKFCARQVAKNAIDVFEVSDMSQVKIQIVSKLPPLPKNQVDERVDNS